MTGSTPVPLGIRGRARLLYRSRRERLLEVPVHAMERRFGAGAVEVDRTDFRYARVRARLDLSVEVAFAGVFKMFGALIDTQWVARQGSPSPGRSVQLEYRFDRETFKGPGTGGNALADRLADARTKTLARRAELKKIRVSDDPEGRLVEIIPLPGTITAMYFPPLPPYTIPIRPSEADDQLELLLHLVDLR